MVRDNEIQRLIKYGQGMGVAVRFKPYIKYSKFEAEWALDGSEIVIFTKPRDSKLQKVLSLIHELSHHKAFVNNGRTIDPKIEEALDSDNNKIHRKRVLNMEVSDSQYWEEIYRDTDCRFNINILHREKEHDLWAYQIYSKTGKFPTHKENLAKAKELRKKYRSK